MNSARLLARLRQGHLENVAFGDLARLLADLGFDLRRITGSHHIYGHAAMSELVNVQSLRGQTKAYQVRQVLHLIEHYNLTLEGDR